VAGDSEGDQRPALNTISLAPGSTSIGSLPQAKAISARKSQLHAEPVVWLSVRLSRNQENHEGKLAMHYLILAGVLSMMTLCMLIIAG
jgi:hypothetical protein